MLKVRAASLARASLPRKSASISLTVCGRDARMYTPPRAPARPAVSLRTSTSPGRSGRPDTGERPEGKKALGRVNFPRLWSTSAIAS